MFNQELGRVMNQDRERETRANLVKSAQVRELHRTWSDGRAGTVDGAIQPERRQLERRVSERRSVGSRSGGWSARVLGWTVGLARSPA